MLKISANDAQLTVVACGPITSDRIDLPCEITLSPEFDGLAVTVVFKAGDVQRDVAMLGSPVHVPAECLEQAGEVLMVGIWAGDGSGRPTIPTVWASAGTIRTGALPSGYDPDEPEPDWAAQVQQAAAQAVATANSVRADADAGVFDGEDGYSPTATVEQLADGATIIITDKDGTTTATVHDGADGRDGTDGTDGYSPTATVTQTTTGATISITDKSGTTTASVSNGTDGTDGTDGVDGFSPTVDVQPITGGHEVTITDADGAHSFEVLDGDPAEPGSITDAMLAPDGIKAQVAQLFGNQLVGTLSGTIDTAADAYAAPPMALVVEGNSTQAGTPTPDAPVPILSVDGLALNVCGKNLIKATANGYINEAGNVYGSSSRYKHTNYIRVSAGQKYVVTQGGINFPTGIRTAYYDNNKSFINALAMSGVPAFVSTAPSNAVYMRTSCEGNYVSNFMVRVGADSVVQPYEPYIGTTVPDLLPEGTELRSLPDGTKDTLNLAYLRPSTRAGWAWYSREVTKRVGEFLATSSNNWNKSSSASNGYHKLVNKITDSRGKSNVGNGIMSPWFKAANSVSEYKQTVNSCWVDGSVNFNIDPDVFSGTASEFGQWVAEHNIEFYMPLATPVTTQLDPIELPELPAPTCTVWCDGGSAQPSFVMQYVQDTNLVIADLRAAIADLATS